MGIFHSNRINLKLTSADIPGTLKYLTEKGFILYEIQYENDLTAYVTIMQKDFNLIQTAIQKRGDQCSLYGKNGRYSFVYHLKRRCVLLIGILCLWILTAYIPSRIFFVQVKGNQTVSSQSILDQAIENGITFGCDRSSIRSEQFKNLILEQIPALDWAGVTTSGCVATIEVKEKAPAKKEPEKNFCNIVSVTHGIVESVTVTRGKAVCAPGQAVRAGQLLISGYVDQGLLIKATGAEGEIYGKTLRTLEAVTPVNYSYRGRIEKIKVNYSLQIGKKVINFTKHSSISHTSCGKIYEKKYLTLPGGYMLPFALIREEIICYESIEDCETEQDFSWLDMTSQQYLYTQMLAGEILKNTSDYTYTDDLCILTGAYLCKEQIGKYKFEENPQNYGENS